MWGVNERDQEGLQGFWLKTGRIKLPFNEKGKVIKGVYLGERGG